MAQRVDITDRKLPRRHRWKSGPDFISLSITELSQCHVYSLFYSSDSFIRELASEGFSAQASDGDETGNSLNYGTDLYPQNFTSFFLYLFPV